MCLCGCSWFHNYWQFKDIRTRLGIDANFSPWKVATLSLAVATVATGLAVATVATGPAVGRRPALPLQHAVEGGDRPCRWVATGLAVATPCRHLSLHACNEAHRTVRTAAATDRTADGLAKRNCAHLALRHSCAPVQCGDAEPHALLRCCA